MMLLSLITGDVNCGHSIKVMSYGFLYSRVTLILAVVNKYTGGNTLRICISFHLKLLPTNFRIF